MSAWKSLSTFPTVGFGDFICIISDSLPVNWRSRSMFFWATVQLFSFRLLDSEMLNLLQGCYVFFVFLLILAPPVDKSRMSTTILRHKDLCTAGKWICFRSNSNKQATQYPQLSAIDIKWMNYLTRMSQNSMTRCIEIAVLYLLAKLVNYLLII